VSQRTLRIYFIDTGLKVFCCSGSSHHYIDFISVCIKNAIFYQKNTKTVDFDLLEELIFAKMGKIIKSVQKMFDLEVFLY